MHSPTPVDRLYDESASVIHALELSEPSLAIAAGDSFRKALVLAAASHFEHRVSSCVLEFIRERANGSGLVVAFVKNKGSMPFCVELDNLKDTDAPIHQPAAMLVAAD